MADRKPVRPVGCCATRPFLLRKNRDSDNARSKAPTGRTGLNAVRLATTDPHPPNLLPSQILVERRTRVGVCMIGRLGSHGVLESIRACFAKSGTPGLSARTARVPIFAQQKWSSSAAASVPDFAMPDSSTPCDPNLDSERQFAPLGRAMAAFQGCKVRIGGKSGENVNFYANLVK